MTRRQRRQRNSNFHEAKMQPTSRAGAHAAWFGSRFLTSDLKFWSFLHWISTDRRLLALALSIEAVQAQSSHSRAQASRIAASRGDNIPAMRRACPARARHSKVSDKPIFVTVRIAVSQVVRCWPRGGESSTLVIILESSPSDWFLIGPRLLPDPSWGVWLLPPANGLEERRQAPFRQKEIPPSGSDQHDLGATLLLENRFRPFLATFYRILPQMTLLQLSIVVIWALDVWIVCKSSLRDGPSSSHVEN